MSLKFDRFSDIVMGAGFSLVAYGVFQAVHLQRIDVAILASAAGILTEFIGATFLVIFRSITRQANTFVQTLERINEVGMSLQIVDSIPGEATEMKNAAKVDLAAKILIRSRAKESSD